MIVSIIAAMGRDGIIGNDAGLPWHLPKDLKRFRQLTTGKPVIMGRRTYALLGKPLPDRFNIVLTHRQDLNPPGYRMAHSVAEALAAACDYLRSTACAQNEVMVIGGGDIYRQFMDSCDRIYLTIVDGQFEGTASFPKERLGDPEWKLISEPEYWPQDEKNPYRHTFCILERFKRHSNTQDADSRTLASLLNSAQ